MDRRFFLKQAGAAALLAGIATVSPSIVWARGTKGISYGSGSLDIYPAANANAPVIAYVHGGAWKAGSRGSVGSMPGYFNALGYTFVSIGYSLGGNPGQQARQVGQALNWLRSNIGQFGGNPSRIAAMGHSAGCHLACLAVLSGAATGIKAIVANDTGAYDVPYLAEINGGRLPLLYAAFSDKSQWRNWSPISYASGGGGIPVLVAWSGGTNRDRISKRFADALAAGGHPVTRFDGRRYNHISIRNAMGRKGDPLTVAITNFLAAHL